MSLELPSHFYWVERGRLAGMGRPGLTGSVEQDLASIRHAGIGLLVSLAADPIPEDVLDRLAIRRLQFPLSDGRLPKLGPVASLCLDVDRHARGHVAAAISCGLGVGSAAMVVAALLTWRGTPAREAVARVRRSSPGSLRVPEQLDFVHRFAATFGSGLDD